MPKGVHSSPKPKRVIPKSAEKLIKNLEEEMARKPTGNPTGRPIKEVDWRDFEALCGFHCTQSEIASFLKISPDALVYKVQEEYGEPYSVVYKKYQESGKCSLRRNQFAMSKTNATMGIWLGKQYLGQKDNEQVQEFTPEQLIQFKTVMEFLGKSQDSASALNKAESSNSNEEKS
jgi:hypothetical protein